MVPLLGRPLIYRQLDIFKFFDIQNITIVGGYHAECLEIPNVEVVLNLRFADTNMVYSVFCAEQFMRQDEDLIISYGDIVFEPNVLEKLLSSTDQVSVVIDRSWYNLWSERMDDPLADAETLKLEDGNRITEIGKKPSDYSEIQGQYIGLIKVNADKVKEFTNVWHQMNRMANYDGKSFDNMYMTSFLQHLIDTSWEVRAVFIEKGWLEVDTVEDLLKYENMENEGRLKEFYNSCIR